MLVDYKTDKTDDEQKYKDDYKLQLDIYKEALEKEFSLPVKQMIIYSFTLGRFIDLETLPTGAGGEYQLTDAMKQLAKSEGMVGVDFTGTRYDMGNKLGILKANCEMGLRHPELKDDFKAYLKELVSKL